MKFGRSIKIFLSDGSPSGLRHLEIANTPTQSSLPRADIARSSPQSWKDDMGRSMKEVEESLLVCS